jgi:hypothetical protein
MKAVFPILLLSVLILTACGTTPPVAVTEVPQAVEFATATLIPGTKIALQPTQTQKIPVTPSPTLDVISSTSPNGEYKASLSTKNSSVELIILETTSNKETRFHLQQNSSDDKGELNWSPDSRLLATTYYYKVTDGYEDVLDLVNVPEGKIIAHYTGASHLYQWNDKENVITLEHGGLNNIFDYYFVKMDCYKLVFDGGCVHPNPPGTWQFYVPTWENELQKWGFEVPNSDDLSNDDIFFIVAANKDGNIWKYSYKANNPDLSVDAEEIHWNKDGKFVYFAPIASGTIGFYSDYGLLRMDLSNGKVEEVIPNSLKFVDEYYDLSISPSEKKAFYIKLKNSIPTAVTRDLTNNTETEIRLSTSTAIFPESTKEDVSLTSEIFWSPDETKVFVINNLTTAGQADQNDNNDTNVNYTIFDLQTGNAITIIKASQTYYSVFDLTNDKISLLDEAAANSAFGNGNVLVYSLVDGKLISETKTSP